MKRILTITDDEDLTRGLEAAADLPDVSFERAPNWEEARSRLVEQPHQVVCIDYETLKIEGMDSFVELDDILQKGETGALVLLREETPRAEQFVATLDSFEALVNLATDPVETFVSRLQALLDRQPAPEESNAPSSSGPAVVEVVLPDIHEGSLSDHSIARILHTLRQQGWSGVLTLKTDEIARTVEIVEGCLLSIPEDERRDLEHLKAAFAWSSGSYEFERDDSVEGTRIEPYPILLEGVENHLDQRAAMQQLRPVMDRYIARTTFLERCRDQLAGRENLEVFLEQADGETTLETALSAIASRMLTGFQAGFFAIECDMVALTESPTGQPVEVEFSSPETSERREHSGGRSGVSPSSSPSSSHREPDTEEREAELRKTFDRIADANAYEVFDLWEGCGEQHVRDRYFELVKRHHPDSHGGNISDEAKELAEKIFIRLKQSYSELLELEDEQSVSRDEAVESDTTGETGLDESLSSPSVTALGEGQAGEAEAGAEDTESDPSLEMGPTTEEMAAPAASKRPSTDNLSADENEARMRYGRPDDEAESSDPGRAQNETVERRTEQLQELRNRLERKSSRSGRQTPVDPDVRERKLASLEGSSDGREPPGDDSDPNELEPPRSEESAQEYFNLGYRAFKNEDEARAHRLFELAHEFDTSNPLWKTFYAYTLFLRDSQQRDDARELLREVVESDDKQAKPDAHLFLGRILKVRNEHDRAKRHFERAVELNPNSVEAKRELRVYEMRDGPGDSDDSDGFLDNLFDRDLF